MSNNMRQARIILLVCGCIAAAACSTLGKYKPVEEVSAGLYGNVEGNDASTSIANFSWKEVFKDPALQDCINIALENNFDLKIAGEHIKQAEAQLTGAKLAYIPTLGVAPFDAMTFSGNRLGNFSNNFDINVTSSWQLNIFRLINNQKAAEATLEQMKDYRQAVQSQIIATVANTYYSLLMLDSQLLTSMGMQKDWKESVDIVIALKEAGLADQVAVSQYEANLNSINITVANLSDQIALAENAMNLLLAREPGTVIPRGNLINQEVPEKIIAGVPALMLTLRPDVRAAQRDLELAHYAKRGALLDFFPLLSIKGEGTILTPLIDVAASLSAPILTAGKNRAAYKAAESKQRETKLAFSQTLYQAGKEVNDAFLEYENCCRLKDEYYNRAVSLDRARQDTEYLMRNSLDKTYLDVLYANTNFLEAMLNTIANRTLMLQSVVNIYTALGGGAI